MTNLLQELVEVNSGTSNIQGVNDVQSIVKRELKLIGFDTELIKDQKSKYGDFLIATLGKKPKHGYVDFVMHADTVFEKESGFLNFELDSKKQTARGPGVIDDKGGIVVAINGVKKFIKNNRSQGLRFICSSCEEVGSPSFQKLLKELGKESSIILGFEPAMDGGSIVDSRRGNRWYDITVKGRTAHAGRDHKTGINAAHELAYKITKLDKLTDYKNDTTLSVGAISGGDKFNVVCGEAHAKLDLRSSTHKCMNDAHKKIIKILSGSSTKNSRGEKPKTSYIIADDCPPFSKSRKSQDHIGTYLDILNKIEKKKYGSVGCGGSADSNYMSREGLVIIDGLGAVGGKMHTKDEFILLSSLETRSEALAEFLKKIQAYK